MSQLKIAIDNTENLLDETNHYTSYILLQKYQKESAILSSAYHKSEKYYRNLYKWLSYPIIITSAVSSIVAGISKPYLHSDYVLMCLSLFTLILSGFNQAISPKDREMVAKQFSTEFEEISSNINQYILENSKTKDEVKHYSILIHETLNLWKSQKPPLRDKFLMEAKKENISRIRKTGGSYNTPNSLKRGIH